VLTATYIHTDALRSVVAETDGSGAVKVNSRPFYEPYGAPWVGYTQGPGYTGHVMDAQTQLVYMQQRYYDPMAGRFLSVDPVAASPLSFNRYWYANNNPYGNLDPDGRQARDSRSIKDMHPSARGDVKTIKLQEGAHKFNVPKGAEQKLPQPLLESAYNDLEGKNKSDKEYGTVGYFDGEKYSSVAMPSVDKGEIPWTFAPQDPRVSYLTHTHGDAKFWYEDYFSADDTSVANTFGKPVFLLNRRDEFKVYLPGMPTGGRLSGSLKLQPGQGTGATLCVVPCR
jgi:RHS repeat-associated protein